MNPMLYDSDVPSTSSYAFPSDTTPQKYPPKRHPLQTPIYEEDLSDVEESDDSEDDNESRSVKKALKSVKSKITDLKAFSAPKGRSSQTPLSSDFASFGTQEAFSEPTFDNDESGYVKSYIDLLEDDEQQLKMIRAQHKRKNQKFQLKLKTISEH